MILLLITKKLMFFPVFLHLHTLASSVLQIAKLLSLLTKIWLASRTLHLKKKKKKEKKMIIGKVRQTLKFIYVVKAAKNIYGIIVKIKERRAVKRSVCVFIIVVFLFILVLFLFLFLLYVLFFFSYSIFSFPMLSSRC